ncbi:Protein FAF-like, chloroplastic [Senna tora]|uniref:Protein FAF-like, chloroplastic n=1 Tax=Senna tora TaxID=362788 RepID=A0A834WHR2_9FABA|nr:Protein FAF-like, chloroplastic [Senna tora]
MDYGLISNNNNNGGWFNSEVLRGGNAIGLQEEKRPSRVLASFQIVNQVFSILASQNHHLLWILHASTHNHLAATATTIVVVITLLSCSEKGGTLHPGLASRGRGGTACEAKVRLGETEKGVEEGKKKMMMKEKKNKKKKKTEQRRISSHKKKLRVGRDDVGPCFGSEALRADFEALVGERALGSLHKWVNVSGSICRIALSLHSFLLRMMDEGWEREWTRSPVSASLEKMKLELESLKLTCQAE